MAEEENGMDELLKLQQQFTRQQEEHEDRKKLQEEQGKKAQGKGNPTKSYSRGREKDLFRAGISRRDHEPDCRGRRAEQGLALHLFSG